MKKHILNSELANVDIETIEKEALIDVSSFTFDHTVSQGQRVPYLIAAVKNPYCFRVGDIGVKLEFSEDALSLQDVFTDFLRRKKSGL